MVSPQTAEDLFTRVCVTLNSLATPRSPDRNGYVLWKGRICSFVVRKAIAYVVVPFKVVQLISRQTFCLTSQLSSCSLAGSCAHRQSEFNEHYLNAVVYFKQPIKLNLYSALDPGVCKCPNTVTLMIRAI